MIRSSEEFLFLPIKAFDYPTAFRFFLNECEFNFGPEKTSWPKSLREIDSESYEISIQQKQIRDPEFACHIWRKSMIVGQLEFQFSADNPQIGQIELLYLIPEMRGPELETVLERFACNKLRAHGCQTIRITVSTKMTSSLATFRNLGWQNLGPAPAIPHAQWLEKSLSAALTQP